MFLSILRSTKLFSHMKWRNFFTKISFTGRSLTLSLSNNKTFRRKSKVASEKLILQSSSILFGLNQTRQRILSKMSNPVFDSELGTKVNTAKILVVGAGGIGCELLKNLVLTGFKDITVVSIIFDSKFKQASLICQSKE